MIVLGAKGMGLLVFMISSTFMLQQYLYIQMYVAFAKSTKKTFDKILLNVGEPGIEPLFLKV